MAAPASLRAGRWDVSAFRAWGWTGFIAAVAVALGVCAQRGQSLAVELVLIATAVATFLALALLTKALTGRETLTYYHHEIAVLAVVAGVAAALGAPVLAHLDATALGLGAFLAFGRIGCLLGGCCHGRPARRGKVYGPVHVQAGFPGYLVGRPLVPVQALEAVAAAALVIGGLVLVPATPGAAFDLYVTGYAVVRFGLEELRGDPVRRYWHGLSEAQWTSLLVTAAMTVADPRHAVVLVPLVVWAAILARHPRGDLLHPRHVRELAGILPAPDTGVAATSLGVRVSAGTEHYTVSHAGHALEPDEAASLASVLVWLRQSRDPAQVVAGTAGVWHVLL